MKKNLFLTTISLLAFSTAVSAQDVTQPSAEENSLDLSIKVGIDYTDNLSVPELDQTSGLGDAAGTLDLSANFKTSLLPALKLAVGYDLSASRYFTQTAYNLEMHTLSASLGYEGESYDFDLGYGYYVTSLGGNKFLTMHRVNPTLSTMSLFDSVYLRAGYALTDKSFENQTGRNGRNHEVAMDAYFFLTEENMVGVTAALIKEDTQDDQYDYSGYRLAGNVSVSAGIGKVYGRLSYENRDYKTGLGDDLSTLRQDKRFSAAAGLEFPLLPMVKLVPEVRYTDVASNLAATDYTEKGASLSVKVSF